MCWSNLIPSTPGALECGEARISRNPTFDRSLGHPDLLSFDPTGKKTDLLHFRTFPARPTYSPSTNILLILNEKIR